MPTTRHQHHFEDLSPADFERLVYWLVRRSGDFDQVQWYGGARDKGRDVVAYKRVPNAKAEKWYIQCKRYQSIDFSTLSVELTKLAEHAQSDQDFAPDVIIFATACPVPPQARDRAAALSQELKLPAPYYWGRLELDEQLKAQPQTEDEFFGEYVGLQANTIEKVLEALNAQRQPAVGVSESLEELIRLLGLRAKDVEEWFRRGEIKRGKKSLSDSLKQFRSLHKAHVAALRNGQLVYAHEILAEVHDLLREYDYGGSYFTAPDFSDSYPGPRDAKEILELYEQLESESVDPIAKGEILLLLAGFGEKDFSDRQIGKIYLRDAKLVNCSFSNSDLTGAVLQRVQFGQVNLSGTCLSRALLSGVELHAYLHDADLRGATFHNMDLDHASLTYSRIDRLRLVNVTSVPLWLMMGLNDSGEFNADLLVSAIQSGYRDATYANLSGANFDNFSIAKVDFEHANLSRSSLRSAVLSEVSFLHADLSEADLQGSRIVDSRFNGASMKSVVLNEAVVNASCLFAVDLEGSDIQRASFSEVELGAASLKRSNLADTVLQKVDLSGAWLTDADLVNVDLSAFDLSKVKLERAKIQGTMGSPKWISIGLDENGRYSQDVLIKAIRAGFRELAGANLAHCSLRELDLSGVNLEGANLDHTYLWDTKLCNANLKAASMEYTELSRANLSNADLSGAKLKSSRLDGVILIGANLTGADFGGNFARARDIPDEVCLDESGVFISMKN